MNFAGVNQATACGGCAPPDTEGAVGTDYFGETTNSHIDMYSKASGGLVRSRNFASFFGYTRTPIFDARIVKDQWTARWIVIAIGDNEGGTGNPQRLFIAVSTTQDITGNWCFYQPNVNYSGDDFFDYPMLGIDQNALIVTGNVFANSTGNLKYGEILAFPKSQILSCQTVTYTIFSGFPHNMAPPIVYDSNPKSYLVSPPESGSQLSLWAGQNLGTPGTSTLTYQGLVAVPSYVMPAPAAQCSTSTHIDVLDARFVNASTQRGNSLWNVHSTSFDPSTTLATPRFYKVDTSTASVADTGQFWFDGNSSDWNASIAVNQLGEATMTWTANEANPCVNPQVRSTGYQPGDFTTDLGTGTLLATSPSIYDPPGLTRECSPGSSLICARWGDYSAVSPDPSAYSGCDPGRRMWLVNERDVSRTDWGSQIAELGWC